MRAASDADGPVYRCQNRTGKLKYLFLCIFMTRRCSSTICEYYIVINTLIRIFFIDVQFLFFSWLLY